MNEGELSPQQLLALTPRRYLAGGFRDAQGATRDEVEQLWALAAAHQLKAARAPIEEVDRAVAAIGRAARGCETVAPEKLFSRFDEGLAEANLSAPVRELIEPWIEAVHETADVGPLLRHAGAVLRLFAMLVAMQRPS